MPPTPTHSPQITYILTGHPCCLISQHSKEFHSFRKACPLHVYLYFKCP